MDVVVFGRNKAYPLEWYVDTAFKYHTKDGRAGTLKDLVCKDYIGCFDLFNLKRFMGDINNGANGLRKLNDIFLPACFNFEEQSKMILDNKQGFSKRIPMGIAQAGTIQRLEKNGAIFDYFNRCLPSDNIIDITAIEPYEITLWNPPKREYFYVPYDSATKEFGTFQSIVGGPKQTLNTYGMDWYGIRPSITIFEEE